MDLSTIQNIVKMAIMTESANLIVSIINLFSLLLGGLTIGLIFKLTKKNNIPYLNYYFFFLVFAVVSGFCDWIIFNWILLLVPGLSSGTVDSIYHIFWDLIGFPSALFGLYFLIKTLNSMLKLEFSLINYRFGISLPFLITILSYVSFYLRLNGIQNFLTASIWIIFIYVFPLVQLSYLAFVYYKSINQKPVNAIVKKLILILFFCFSIWHFLSLVHIQYGIWRHLIIFTYYLALFLPTIYLYLFVKRESLEIIEENQDNKNLEDVFTAYSFTSREKELVILLLDGKSNKEISEELFISLQTVKNYVSKIYKKIGLKNRIELVNFIRKYT